MTQLLYDNNETMNVHTYTYAAYIRILLNREHLHIATAQQSTKTLYPFRRYIGLRST